MTSEHFYSQAVVERSKLAQVLRGGERPNTTPLRVNEIFPSSIKDVVLVWNAWSSRPCAVIVENDGMTEFLSWLYAYHTDLTPLTSWTQLYSKADWVDLCANMDLSPEFYGLETAWCGAIISEAISNAGREFTDLSLASCTATYSFSIARAFALYGADYARSIVLNPPQSNLKPYRDKTYTDGDLLEKILISVIDIKQSEHLSQDYHRIFMDVIRTIHLNEGRISNNGADKRIADLFNLIPGAPAVQNLSSVSAEDLIRLLRILRDKSTTSNVDILTIVQFLAGLVIAQVGGSERDLKLAEQFKDHSSGVRLWAMVIGGLGSEFYWGSAFAGLGRLVARELTRPVHLGDAPLSDIAITELNFTEKANSFSISNLKSANRNILNVSLRAGVQTGFYLNEQKEPRVEVAVGTNPPDHGRREDNYESWRDVDYAQLARRMLPHLRPLIIDEVQRLTPRKTSRKAQTEMKLKGQ